MIQKEMINSKAFKELTNAARVALLLLKAQCCRADQNEVKCPYVYAELYMHKHTWHSAIDLLIAKGFINKEQEGGLFRKTNVYSFVDRWKTDSMAYL